MSYTHDRRLAERLPGRRRRAPAAHPVGTVLDVDQRRRVRDDPFRSWPPSSEGRRQPQSSTRSSLRWPLCRRRLRCRSKSTQLADAVVGPNRDPTWRRLMPGLTALEAELERAWRKYHVRAQLRTLRVRVRHRAGAGATQRRRWTGPRSCRSQGPRRGRPRMETWPTVPWKLIRTRLRTGPAEVPKAVKHGTDPRGLRRHHPDGGLPGDAGHPPGGTRRRGQARRSLG